MNLEEIEKRYAKGYDYTNIVYRNQLYNDMEWLMDKVERYEKALEQINETAVYYGNKSWALNPEKIGSIATEALDR
jgi:hypothetical protein